MIVSSCPYLGLRGDPETQVSFPSQSNFCHHLKTSAPVSLEYQRAFCQSAHHTQCLVFHQEGHLRLPVEAQVIASNGKIIRRSWILVIALVLILLAVGGIALGPLDQGISSLSLPISPHTNKTLPAPSGTARPSPSLPALSGALGYFTPTTFRPTAALPSGTVAFEVTLATATCAPLGLETPVGTNPTLLIHRVLPGENLELIAAHFDTSIEAIQNINYFLPSPLWADLPLVVPLGRTQTVGLPQFEAYEVSANGIEVEQLAQSLGVDAMQLRKYNLLPERATLIAGQWLILPRLSK
jgi:hypothetical protein